MTSDLDHPHGPPLLVIAREWGRIGVTGFGGPPAHIALLRQLCVDRRGWISPTEFEDGVAATSLLPGPASTQLAIFTAWRLRGIPGALVGGLCFIVPGLVLILALSALFLSGHPPVWVRGAAAGAGAAVAAVAVAAAVGLVPASWTRTGSRPGARARWVGYGVAGGLAAWLIGPWLVLVPLTAGLLELGVRTPPRSGGSRSGGSRSGGSRWRASGVIPLAVAPAAVSGLTALTWVAFKVGALSYGGGFVIIPLMQQDVVHTYRWMTDGQFLNVVALGQVTPGPVVLTVAAVGFAAAGLGGGLLAAAVAFAPSFLFVILGGPRFDQLRVNVQVQAFLSGAGPAVIGAIAGSSIPLATALHHPWQYGVLAAAAFWLLAARRGVVTALLGAAAVGVVAGLIGQPVT